MFHVRAIWQLRGKIFLGTLLGVLGLLFFIAYDAQAMIIDNTQVEIRDSDIIGTELDLTDIGNQYVKIQYIGNWKDTINIDEIGTYYERVGNTYKVFTGPTYYKDSDLWFEIEYATTTLVEFQKATEENEIIGLLKYIIPQVNAQTVYSGAGDGQVQANNASWDTVHDATTGSVNYTAANLTVLTQLTSTKYINRIFLPFDTSILDEKLIDTASLFFYSSSVVDGDDTYINVVGTTTQASPTTLSANDFDNCGVVDNPTKLSGDLDIGSVSTGAYNEFELNTAGKWVIDTTGWSYFGIRTGFDIDDSSAGTGENRVYIAMSETAGTDQDPYLLITLAEEEEEEGTSTPSVSIPCDLVPNNELSMAVWCVEEWGDSTTSPEKTFYGYAHIPFLVWFIIMVPTLWLAGRLLLEFIIRLRRY